MRFPRGLATGAAQKMIPPLKSAVFILIAFACLTLPSSGRAATPLPGDALPYAKSYIVTGDYAVGGVDLAPGGAVNGFITGTIHMGTDADSTRNVPANADILP